jgi:uncharacterized protein (DUF2141 family)
MKNIRYLKRKAASMRTLFFTAFLLFLGPFRISAQEDTTVTLTIEVEIIKYNEGSMMFALYNSQETYMKSSLRSSRAEVKDNKAVIVFENLQKGSYGFSFFHDVNNDRKLNKNFVGIPKEPYGFSNGEKGSFGPPDFDKIKFELVENKTISVQVK